MSFLFTHLFFIWILATLYAYFKKITLTRTIWVILLFGAIFPDIDVPPDWIFGTVLHRTFTHSFLMVFFAFAAMTLIYGTFIKNYKQAAFFGILFSFGILSHLLLDFLGPEGIPLFWPSTTYYSLMDGVHDITTRHLHVFTDTPAHMIRAIKLLLTDSILGFLWISYLFWKRKIKNF